MKIPEKGSELGRFRWFGLRGKEETSLRSSAYCGERRGFVLAHNPLVPGSSPGGPTRFPQKCLGKPFGFNRLAAGQRTLGRLE